MDPSPSVRKAYAQAIAWVCKVAKKKPVRKVIEDMSHLYLNDKTEAEVCSSCSSRRLSGAKWGGVCWDAN